MRDPAGDANATGMRTGYFPEPRERWITQLREPPSLGQRMRDRLAFPWLALHSAEDARTIACTPLDLERLLAVMPLLRGRVLDVGCGDNLLVEAWGNGIGVDVVNWGHADRVLDPDGTLPFDPGSFDTVVFAASLNHIPNRARMLGEAFRVLVPGGRIVLTMLDPWIGRAVHRIRHRQDPDQAVREARTGEEPGLSGAEVRRLITGSGFLDLRSRRFVWGLNRIDWASKPGGA